MNLRVRMRVPATRDSESADRKPVYHRLLCWTVGGDNPMRHTASRRVGAVFFMRKSHGQCRLELRRCVRRVGRSPRWACACFCCQWLLRRLGYPWLLRWFLPCRHFVHDICPPVCGRLIQSKHRFCSVSAVPCRGVLFGRLRNFQRQRPVSDVQALELQVC